MDGLLIVLGLALIGIAFCDLVNTLVTTSTSSARWWPSRVVGYRTFAALRIATSRTKEGSPLRERSLSLYAPLLVLTLLAMWTAMQIVGFALIWWAIGGVDGVDSFSDAAYYSGVVYFTLGFGEVLPEAGLARFGALIEAFAGVTNTALVIGYLPSLYSAYSSREQQLMTLDDGSDDRITPTNLVMAWAPDADAERLNGRFTEWELWVTNVLETHATLPLLKFFRSHDERQNWITALGLLSDAAVHAQIIVGSSGRSESYWFLRRAIALFEELTEGVDLSTYDHLVPNPDGPVDSPLFRELYDELEAHGFELLPYEEAGRRARAIRARFARELEYLIDALLCPRGFWSLDIGLVLERPSLGADSKL